MIERYELPVRLTANQNLILLDVEEAWKADIITTLGERAQALHQPHHVGGSVCSHPPAFQLPVVTLPDQDEKTSNTASSQAVHTSLLALN